MSEKQRRPVNSRKLKLSKIQSAITQTQMRKESEGARGALVGTKELQDQGTPVSSSSEFKRKGSEDVNTELTD